MAARKTEELASAEWSAAILGADDLRKAVGAQKDFPKDSAEWYAGCLRALIRELAELEALSRHCEFGWLRWGRVSREEAQALGDEGNRAIKTAFLLLHRLEFSLRRGTPGARVRSDSPAFADAAAAMLARAQSGGDRQVSSVTDAPQTETELYARRLDRVVLILGDFAATAHNLSAWWETTGRLPARYSLCFAARLAKLAGFLTDFAGKLRAGRRLAPSYGRKTRDQAYLDEPSAVRFQARLSACDDRDDEDLHWNDDLPTMPEPKAGQTMVIFIGNGGESGRALAVLEEAARAVNGGSAGGSEPPEDSASWFARLLVYVLLESFSIPSFEGYTKAMWIHQKKATRQELCALDGIFDELEDVATLVKGKCKAFPGREAEAVTLPVTDPAFAAAAAPVRDWLAQRSRPMDTGFLAPGYSGIEGHARRLDNMSALLVALASTMHNLAPWWFGTGSFSQEEIDLRAAQFRAWAVPMTESAGRIRQCCRSNTPDPETAPA